MNPNPEEITQLLEEMRSGDPDAHSRLIALVYPELRRIASKYMSRERPGHTLQPTALVHEAFVRLAGQAMVWQNRDHFFAVASEVMRRVLVDHARRHSSLKRGGEAVRVDFEEGLLLDGRQLDLVLGIDEALDRLARWDQRQAQIVVFRIFGGLTEEEIAGVLKVSSHTVKRDWKMAKAWLRGALESREVGHDGRTLE